MNQKNDKALLIKSLIFFLCDLKYAQAFKSESYVSYVLKSTSSVALMISLIFRN